MGSAIPKAVIVSFGLTGWVITPAQAQDPAPPPLPAAALPAPNDAAPAVPMIVAEDSQVPLAPPPFVAPTGCEPRKGLIGRCVDRLRFRTRDHLIGYPEYFDEPENGASMYQAFGRQKNKADVHTFTLYRSDFIAGTTELSPGGARRLSFLASRLETWPGPVVIEWTPEQPEVAEARRFKVLAALQSGPQLVSSERVLVGPSAYRGLMGPDAGNNHDALIFRDYTAPRAYSVTPTSTADFGGGAR